MSEEQFQRHVDFMIAQQAKFDAKMGKLADVVLSMANHVERHDKQIEEMIEHGKETDRRSKETDERINALIGMAERFFNRNGNQA